MTPLSNPDVVLIGSGIMSSNLGALLKKLDPQMSIQLFEVTDEFAREASNGWNNAGTGHAGICELSYTPDQAADGSVDVSNAIQIFEQFEASRQFWAYAVSEGMITNPRDCINPVAHMSFVHGEKQVDFLRERHKGMAAHHFFQTMTYSTDRAEIGAWAPLLLDGRDPEVPIAATRMEVGTDVNFGSIAMSLVKWLDEQENCSALTGHKVVGLERNGDRWGRIGRKSRDRNRVGHFGQVCFRRARAEEVSPSFRRRVFLPLRVWEDSPSVDNGLFARTPK